MTEAKSGFLDSLEPKCLRTILLIHSILCAFGLILIVGFASRPLSVPLIHKPAEFHALPWVRPFFYSGKWEIILRYILTSAALFVYAVAIRFTYIVRADQPSAFGNFQDWLARKPGRALYCLAGVALFNLPFLIAIKMFTGVTFTKAIALGLMWAAVALAPVIVQFILEPIDVYRELLKPRTIKVLLTLLVLQGIGIFIPYLTGPLRMLNDSARVPEKTILSSGIVDNATYIREHHIFGLGTDRSGDPATDLYGVGIPVQDGPLFRSFLEKWNPQFIYERKRGVVLPVAPIDEEAAEQLDQFLSDKEDSARAKRVSMRSKSPTTYRVYTAEEEEFIKKNSLEIYWQVLNRWAIHHHNFVLAPINAYDLGVPAQKINFQYGVWNTLGVHKIMQLFGGITLENYFRAWYLFYPLYFALLLGVGYYVFGTLSHVLLLGALSLSFTNFLDFEKILRAPGLNPIRHFFDILVVACLWRYWKDSRLRYLAAAFAVTILQMNGNREFGIFVLIALVLTQIYKIVNETRRPSGPAYAVTVLGCLAAASTLILVSGDKNVMTPYYLGGLASPPPPQLLMPLALVSFAALFSLSLWNRSRAPLPRKCLNLFLALYSNGIFIYYVWGASPPHFLNIAPVFAITLVSALTLIFEGMGWQAKLPRLLQSLSVAVLIGLYLPSLVIYLRSAIGFGQIFETHVVYDWNLPRAHIRTTMNPAPFEEAVHLLQKYSPGEKSVYILSKQDNILPFLAERYSAMPYFDVAWFLLTTKEQRQVVDTIRTDKPAYLFVDTDIDGNYYDDIPDKGSFYNREDIHYEAVLDALRFEALESVYDSVKSDYEEVARGAFLKVLHRKNPKS